MNYHLHHDGQDLGIFSLQELQQRMARGELTGTELVWCEGMTEWQPLNSILPPKLSGMAKTPSGGSNKTFVTAMVILVIGLILVCGLAAAIGYGKSHWGLSHNSPVTQSGDDQPSTQTDALSAAQKPVTPNPDTATETSLMPERREFRQRQYVEGYKLRGERNPNTDAMVMGYLQNWIAYKYNGTIDTNWPPLDELGDQLATNPNCTDPLVLTVLGANTVNLEESIHRLERAVAGFGNSKHLAYPKLYATVLLADKVIVDRNNRVPALDATALQYLQTALQDGSFQPSDQKELADILYEGWAKNFRARNRKNVSQIIQGQGDAFQWLALFLQGDDEIDAAWRARGGGYAATVTDAGWNGFRDDLAEARKDLTRAWKLQPDWPLAPCRMIYVSLGDSTIGEMRVWFDRTVAAQIDYPEAWSNMRWGLRPRWYGDETAMLAFGQTALRTHRFDTDVPRMLFDSIADVESEMGEPLGQHIYNRDDVWPSLQEMYEGYIAEPSQAATRNGWRSTYAVVAYLAEKYDVARQQLEALQWQPVQWSQTGWNLDMSLLPYAVAARTGAQGEAVNAAELMCKTDVNGGLTAYQQLATATNLDERTRTFIRERISTLTMEKQLQTDQWVPFLPTDTNLTGWYAQLGECRVLPDGALEVKSDPYGHLLYCRAPMNPNFEVRGQFEVVSSTSHSFQGGLVMGFPDYESYNWYAFRMRRTEDDGDMASFSQHWTLKQIAEKTPLNDQINTFDFHFQNGYFSATVNGKVVFDHVLPPKSNYVMPSQFLVGLGAFNNENTTVIRYRNVEIRQLSE